MHHDVKEPTYGIGAVARLTGIRLESLRAWERRYQVVTPHRTAANQRLYSREDVARLQLIKQLVDRGHVVSSVASLSEQALRDRLRAHLETAPVPLTDARRVPVMVYGETMPFLVESWRGDLPFEVLAACARFSDFEAEVSQRQPEVLILELPVLSPDMPARLRAVGLQSGARRIVAVYGFGTQSVLELLQRDGVVTLRAPVTAQELAQACRIDDERARVVRALTSEASALTGDIPPRRFDGKQLAAVATVTTGIRCECPHHLADLVLRLGAFEAYSADCEQRNEQDSALHAQLCRAAASARALLEEALDELIRYEGLDLPPSRMDPSSGRSGVPCSSAA